MVTQISLGGKTVYITPTGFRVGSRGRVMHPVMLYLTLDKPLRRKLRKTAYRAGYGSHAAAGLQ